MIVDIDQFDYLTGSAETAGIKLVIHDRRRLPFPEDEGVLVGPGRTTSIGMQKVTTRT
jgi:Amiloride-sensitive sodium channel